MQAGIDSNIIHYFLQAAKKQPDHIAIIQNDSHITFGDLHKLVLSRANYFKSQGLQKRDRVLVLVPMSLTLYANILALFFIGVVPVFIDEWVSLKRLRECCQLADCKGVLHGKLIEVFGFFVKEIKAIPLKLKPVTNDEPTAMEAENCLPEDPALITFTTGSTGVPKAAIRTHAILGEQFTALRDKTAMKASDVVMTTLPIVLLISLGAGAASVMAKFKPKKPHMMQADKIGEQIKKHAVNALIASPYFLLRLSNLGQQADKLEKVFTGGAPVFPEDAKKLKSNFPRATIEMVFGSTEAEPISSIIADELIKEERETSDKGLCVGKVHPIAEVQIIPYLRANWGIMEKEEWTALVANHQGWGEIVVKGPHVVKEYLHNENAFRENKIMVDDAIWHRTADAGLIDEKGKLYLLGRCKYMIERGGKTYSPFVYEAVLKQIDGIKMATCLLLGGQLTLVIERTQGVRKKKIIESLKREFKMEYERIIFLSKIPKDPRHFSKVDYERLVKAVFEISILFKK